MSEQEFDYTGFMEQLGVKTEPEKSAVEQQQEQPEAGAEVEQPAVEQEQQVEQQEKPAEQQKPNINEASSKAFAEMRIQNKNYKGTIDSLAKLIGVQSGNPEELLSKVNEILLGAQAKKDNVPQDLLKEVQDLRSLKTDMVKQQREQATLLGLRKLSETYGLKQDEISSFIDELITSGNNPLENEIDILQTYKTLHFEDIIQQEVKKALAENQARLDKANANGTAPLQQNGGGTVEQGKITDVKSLDALLATRK